MKKSLLSGATAILAAMSLTGCGSNIDTVKEGVLPEHKALTVGQAFDNWSNCKSGAWSEYEKDNALKIVEFSCDQKGATDYYLKIKKSALGGKNSKNTFLDIKSSTIKYQFAINKDDTFDLVSIEDVQVWHDDIQASIALKEPNQLKVLTGKVYEDANIYPEVDSVDRYTAQAVAKGFLKKREEAVKTEYIKNPTDEKVQLALIQIDYKNIKEIKNPSEAVQLAAEKERSYSMH